MLRDTKIIRVFQYIWAGLLFIILTPLRVLFWAMRCVGYMLSMIIIYPIGKLCLWIMLMILFIPLQLWLDDTVMNSLTEKMTALLFDTNYHARGEMYFLYPHGDFELIFVMGVAILLATVKEFQIGKYLKKD